MSSLAAVLSDRRLLLGAVGLFIIGIIAIIPIVPMQTRLFFPLSFVTFIPAFEGLRIGGNQSYSFWFGGVIGASIAPILFLLAIAHVKKTSVFLPKSSVIFFFIVSVASLTWTILGWKATLEWTSLYRALSVSAQATIPPIVLGVIAWLTRAELTINRAVALHWFALAWFAWSAFPWYGELL
jgi:hypothetical protein